MTDQQGSALVAQVIDWQEPLDDAAITARLDALDLENPDLRREVLETLDVLAEQLVGRELSADTGLKARIRTMRQAVADRTAADNDTTVRPLDSGSLSVGPASSEPDHRSPPGGATP